MNQKRFIKVSRNIPSNLYNTLEEKLRIPNQEKDEDTTDPSIMITCPKCGKALDKNKVVKHKYICYECGYYYRVNTNNRIRMVAAAKTFEPWFEVLDVVHPRALDGYEDNLEQASGEIGVRHAVRVG